MRVTVLLFARPRDVVGASRLEVDLPDGATAGDAFEALVRRAPGLADMKSRIRCAVEGEYSNWQAPLRDGSELALIPPTAGG
ncbi:MAG TPA: MoaD/ThiS family protein [Candidatus Dormibacteraeota bacterium]